MRSKLATYALAGTIGLAGVAGAALVAPAVSYAATGDSAALTDRVSSIRSALAGLVSDGTITQAQADRVASVVAEARPEGHGPGGRHGGRGGRGGVDMTAAAEALDLTVAELRAQQEAGKTLADIADAQGVPQADLVQALVAAEKARLAQAVTDGRLTQAQADERAAGLEARITDKLDELCGPGGGRGPLDGDGEGEATAPPSTAPSVESSSTDSNA